MTAQRTLKRDALRRVKRWGQYRKESVVVYAFHYRGEHDHNLLRLFVGPDMPLHMIGDGKIGIDTLEGVITASPGDWIIKGVKGEFYPCKPDIFAATYKPVNAQSQAGGKRREHGGR